MNIPTLTDWKDQITTYLQNRTAHIQDGAHDLGHFERVWKTCEYINEKEGFPADPVVLLVAAYFHDLIALPKNHPQRRESSRLSADKTVELLTYHFKGWPAEKTEAVRHAIHAHSFSAGVAPLTIEAKILQDADRMEAIGAIGLARVFYTAGQLGQQLFDPEDPLAINREPNDQVYALDHFQIKLLKLPSLMNTATGRRMAQKNADYLREFLVRIQEEITGVYND